MFNCAVCRAQGASSTFSSMCKVSSYIPSSFFPTLFHLKLLFSTLFPLRPLLFYDTFGTKRSIFVPTHFFVPLFFLTLPDFAPIDLDVLFFFCQG